MKIKITLMIVTITLMMVISVVALTTTTTNTKLTQDEITKLSKLNITKLSIENYPCSTGLCFKFKGDLDDKLITIPEQSCIHPHMKEVWINQTRLVYGKKNNVWGYYPIRVKTKVKQWDGTNTCLPISNEDLYYYLDTSSYKKIKDLITIKTQTNGTIKYGDRSIL